jgi:predicted DNA-binding helix-hairpin-helix protein
MSLARIYPKPLDVQNGRSYNSGMLTSIRPDTQQKIHLLGQMAALDCEGELSSLRVEEDLAPRQRAGRDFLDQAVVQVQRSDGPVTVLRTLQTSACEKNCHYCPFRAGRDRALRVSFSPDELAGEFDRMQRAGVVKGLFLSSGSVGGGAKAMDPMLATAELLRTKYEYRGYIHLKIMPGAEYAQVAHALRLADRVSVNLEGANTERLAFLAPQKDLKGELLPAMHWVHEILQEQCMLSNSPGRSWLDTPFAHWARVTEPGERGRVWRDKAPSMTTQFVVGPAGETDRELLVTVDWLYRNVKLTRAYYSGFNPVSDTPLAGAAPTPASRQHRLYQADWLLRFYDFALNELPFDQSGGLPSNVDPKLAWARQHLADRPVEINRASRRELLRVPGIGPRSADAILRARRQGRVRELGDLRALGAVADRAAPFVLLDGKRPPRQLAFWNEM